MHLVPRHEFKRFHVQFGSTFIMEKLRGIAAAELDNYLGAMMKKTERALLAEVARQGFESFAHRRLAPGGQFEVRHFSDSLTASYQLDIPERKAKEFRRHAEVARNALQPGTYGCMPDSYPAVDAMAWADAACKSLDLFQMTVSVDHGMSAAKLAGVLKAMGANAKDAKLFWVVPSDMFDDFPPQACYNVDGGLRKAVGTPSILSDLKQFVLAVPLVV